MSLADQISLRPGARWLEFHPAMATQIEPGLTEDQVRVITIKSAHGPTAAMEVNGQLLFACGMFTISRESVEVWALISPSLKRRYPILLTRKIIELLDIYALSEGLRSVFMYVECARKDAQAWAYSLGFQPTGEILNYANPGAGIFIFTKEFNHGSSNSIYSSRRNRQDGD